MLVPCLLVAMIVALVSIAPNFSVFHPNRESAHREVERISQSPAGSNAAHKLERLSDGPMTLGTLTISYLSGAIQGELFWRLFLLSSITFIVTKMTKGTASSRVLILAVFGVATIAALSDVAWRAANTKMIFSYLGMENPLHDPFWAVVSRTLLRTFPGNVGFGWLYIRFGIESAILSAFVTSVISYTLIRLVVVHLV